MDDYFLQTLTPLQRLALAHAPASLRGDVLALLALDTRLAGVVRQPGDPILRQMKLAWWRDMLRADPSGWPEGEPLLALLRGFSASPATLVGVVDGWEALLGEWLDEEALAQFAQGRAAGWAGLAGDDAPGARQAARQYALADLALNLANPEEIARARKAALEESAPRLPRRLRPLALLHGMTRRALEKGAETALDGPAAALTALRLGLFGR